MERIDRVKATLDQVRVNSRFLSGLSPDEINAITAMGRFRRFRPNTQITDAEVDAECLSLILEGSVRASILTPHGEKIVIGWSIAGDVMGWSALMPTTVKYILSWESVQASSVLVWDRATIRALAVKYPRLVENGMLLAHDYLIHYRDLHLAAHYLSAPQRLAQTLCALADRIGHRVTDGVELHIGNEELASQTSMTLFTVSRLMQEWQRKGLLTKRRGAVVVRRQNDLLLVHA